MPAAPENVSLQFRAGEVRAVGGGNLHASLFCNFSRHVNHNLPAPIITRVQPWRVSMNAEKISRPFAALPLHGRNARGPTPFSPSNRGNLRHSLPSYTTWENSLSYNQ